MATWAHLPWCERRFVGHVHDEVHHLLSTLPKQGAFDVIDFTRRCILASTAAVMVGPAFARLPDWPEWYAAFDDASIEVFYNPPMAAKEARARCAAAREKVMKLIGEYVLKRRADPALQCDYDLIHVRPHVMLLGPHTVPCAVRR